MKAFYKTFVYIFMSIQLLVVLHAAPSQFKFDSYFAEIVTRVLFSITKVNHMYNFFTDPLKTGKYSYTTNEIWLLKYKNHQLIQKIITEDGSIKPIVHQVNQARVSHIQALATRDTSFYNAIIRSQALYLIHTNKTYPILSVAVLHHECDAIRRGNTFAKVEKIDTVYHNLFSVE